MNKLMIMAALAAIGVWMTTGCSTCCKKDASCTKPTASVTCTNGTSLAAGNCTNKLSADFIACGGTNKLSADFIACGGTNKLSADFIACGGGCTNKLTIAKI